MGNIVGGCYRFKFKQGYNLGAVWIQRNLWTLQSAFPGRPIARRWPDGLASDNCSIKIKRIRFRSEHWIGSAQSTRPSMLFSFWLEKEAIWWSAFAGSRHSFWTAASGRTNPGPSGGQNDTSSPPPALHSYSSRWFLRRPEKLSGQQKKRNVS